MTDRSGPLVAALLTVLIAMAYGVLEGLTDARPALLAFVVGGLVLGLVWPSPWVLLARPLAGALSLRHFGGRRLDEFARH